MIEIEGEREGERGEGGGREEGGKRQGIYSVCV